MCLIAQGTLLGIAPDTEHSAQAWAWEVGLFHVQGHGTHKVHSNGLKKNLLKYIMDSSTMQWLQLK